VKAIIDKVMAFIDNEMLWLQFGAAIEISSDALHDCPDVLAKEIMEELEAALEQFKGIVEELGENGTTSE
jgi:hypothetical protein